MNLLEVFSNFKRYGAWSAYVKRESLLREYMWEHLASTLLGTIENQTFNIYTGSGANGKSKLVELKYLQY